MKYAKHLFITIVSTALVGCSLGAGGRKNVQNQNNLDEIVANAIIGVGTKNDRNILFSFAALTDIDRAQLVNEFETRRSALPKTNSVKGFNSSHQVTIIKMAGRACEVAILNGQGGLRAIAGENGATDVNYNGATTQFNDSLRRAVIRNLANQFWHRSPSATEEAELMSLFNDVIGEGVDTRRTVASMCTAVLSAWRVFEQ